MKYLIIDSSALFSIQYFGMQNGEPLKAHLQKEINVSALYGYFYNGYARLLNYFGIPNERVYHVLDNPNGSYYRKEIYPEYKAHRKEKEVEFIEQYAVLPYFLQAYDENVIQQDGVEADDLIGSLTEQLLSQGHEVVIFSKDKDFLQLLKSGVELVKEVKTEEGRFFSTYKSDYVQKEYGFSADSFIDYLALVGDLADNVPGVKGIGDKMARELLVEHVNIEMIYANLDNIKKRPQALLKASQEEAFLSKRLVAIRRDLPVQVLSNRLNEQVKLKLQAILTKARKEMEQRFETVDM